jgi:hypothetical protein
MRRCSNDSSAVINARVQQLVDYAVKYPAIRFYLGTVVMRIPAYNGAEEEPWYWAYWGQDLFTYSFYSDKYTHTHNASDLAAAKAAEALVPSAIVAEFVWRRQRNHNATVLLLEMYANR